ncbi:MAG: bifunctional phosphoribosylaminoimidazolecarboxamide formyltransferase/IMP cyclohydrolase [Candidatus Planktophila sp.]|nr:bifunctional phosphoribosylaminoimidazolecarboxamide formyltransferase/IMP cyclohydrolase [Candidatus Planktophila sp.]
MKKVIQRALISVYDKDRLIEVGNALHSAGVEILSTGSTANTLKNSGIPVTEVSDYTGFPEIMDGRVKSLHPRIHAGILADQSNPDHQSAIADLEISPFDLVIINLYPFSQTVASGATFEDSIEQIDIGGPALLRGAAKNHKSVAVISAPSQYDQLLIAISSGGFTQSERRQLALEAFRKTAEYDLAIATWLAESDTQELPDWFGYVWSRKSALRYGENPHQSAAIYSNSDSGIVNAQQLHGKEMSFNNYTDADAAWRAVRDHRDPAVAIMKHANPCGIAVCALGVAVAYQHAHECDPVSAFGGVVAANRKVDLAMAEPLSKIFTEVVVAPDYDREALELLMKKPSIRILKVNETPLAPFELRPVSGGILLQQSDLIDAAGDLPAQWKQVCGPEVDEQKMKDLEFAWRSVRSVKSNAIILASMTTAVGIGMGQVSRVDSARLAVSRAGDRAKGSVAASDAFFPFADGLQILIDAGITAVVQPGGSVRDEEVIAAAQAAGIAMFFTNTRHFSHA